MNSKKFEKKCFYLPVEGRDIDLVRQGVFWLFANSKLHGGWLAVNCIENLETISTLYPGLEQLIKLKNNKYEIINGVPIYLITEHTLPDDGKKRPMLAIHPTIKLLNNLDKIPNVSQMTVVPWLGKEAQDWIKLRNAMEISTMDTSDNSLNPLVDLDKLVIAALQDFNSKVNFCQGVWEMDVRLGSIMLFRILHDNNIDYDPRSVKKYLRDKLDWNPLAADQAAKVSDGVRSGDRYEGFYSGNIEYLRNKFWKNNNDSIYAWRIKARDL